MLDFVQIKASYSKKDVVDIYPEFITKRSKDLMIKGKSFYAIWDESSGFWSTSEYDAQRLIDNEIFEFANNYKTEDKKNIKLLKNFSTRKFVEFQTYCKSLPDNYRELDEKIIFLNTPINKFDYSTNRLNYTMELGDMSSYEELIGTLYSPEEKEKLEWAIGSIISGESKKIQKFIVLFGAPGSGKSTFLNIVEMMFPGYCGDFDSQSLVGNSQFGLESLRDNPLIGIQHEGNLSRIEDNARLNSIVSHEKIVVNEKFKSSYSSKFKTFLILSTNSPVKITDSKSGIIRRLIDVTPSNKKIPEKRYEELMEKVKFELGAIAYHCFNVFKTLGPRYYNNYIPVRMIESTNNFYNFINDEYAFFAIENTEIDLNTAWKRYKQYCQDANIQHPFEKRVFKSELSNYFESFENNVYKGFKKEKFKVIDLKDDNWIIFEEQGSLFDKEFKDCIAQYANKDEKPLKKWSEVTTTLYQLNTKRVHYILLPKNIITIDFDLKDENGKSLEKNIEAAKKWPKTYCELSKSGQGIHLHYIYNGDIEKLSRVFDDNIEIKVSVGNSSLRRKLTKCNNLPIATINSGLPLKEEKVLNANMIVNEEKLRGLVIRNLKKEIHGYTKPSIDFIYKLLEDAYNSDIVYDLKDLEPDIIQFANNSTNNADYCLNVVSKMHFSSKNRLENLKVDNDDPIIFFDIEIFPNLFVFAWVKGLEETGHYLFNPSAEEIRLFFDKKLVGFNNRKYDNHIIWARTMGYTVPQLYDLSQRIIKEGILKAGFNEAYNISYTDVYDFLSSGNKMSLKKWEIKLGINHLELNYPWDKEVPEDMYEQVALYCLNDVFATRSVFYSKQGQADFNARKILANLSGLTVNNTTNQHTTKLIVGDDKEPQNKFVYTDLSTIFPGYEFSNFGIDKSKYNPGTKIVKGKSLYLGEDPGEGGYVYANPGIYYDTGLFDIASMHPTSAHELDVFGPYDESFWRLVLIRLHIKHKEYDEVIKLYPELKEYLGSDESAKELSDALKTAINSVYGLTSATFQNRLKDPRNVDNIVAKRGALFMINLKHEVQKKGYIVVHIKTDSIKVANSDDYIKNFIIEYGKKYGYTFEHEATYKKICLVNESTYVAMTDKGKWTATGEQFQVPYVFKTLFSHEPIKFEDMCETNTVTSAMYLDMNEDLPEGEHDYKFVGRVGQFTPMKKGGGILLRDAGNGKFSAVNNTKKKDGVYRWLESPMVQTLHLEEDIDKSFYTNLVDKAVAAISKFGDVEQFLSDVAFDDVVPFN